MAEAECGLAISTLSFSTEEFLDLLEPAEADPDPEPGDPFEPLEPDLPGLFKAPEPDLPDFVEPDLLDLVEPELLDFAESSLLEPETLEPGLPDLPPPDSVPEFSITTKPVSAELSVDNS
jgi:hypothetical protein